MLLVSVIFGLFCSTNATPNFIVMLMDDVSALSVILFSFCEQLSRLINRCQISSLTIVMVSKGRKHEPTHG